MLHSNNYGDVRFVMQRAVAIHLYYQSVMLCQALATL